MVTPTRLKQTRGPRGGHLYLCPCGVILHTPDAPHTTDCPYVTTPTPPPSEQVTLTMEGLHLDVAVTGGDPTQPYWADPGEPPEEQWLLIEIGTDGIGGVGHNYQAPGTYRVRVAREDGTVLKDENVTAST